MQADEEGRQKVPFKCCQMLFISCILSKFRFDVSACLQEHTEREEVAKGARAEEDRNKEEGPNGQKQADEEQQRKVTFQISAVPLSQICAYIWRLFLSDSPRWDFFFACSQGVHRTRGGGEASSQYSGRAVLGSRYAPTEASG